MIDIAYQCITNVYSLQLIKHLYNYNNSDGIYRNLNILTISLRLLVLTMKHFKYIISEDIL